jgi:FMN-dependent NADH-azoreductase
MKILHISCSPRGLAAESTLLSQKIIGFLLKTEPTTVVVNRVIGGQAMGGQAIGADALLPIDKGYATALSTTQQLSADLSEEGSMAQSEALIQELEAADVVVIATPMHNLTVPAALKSWIDHIVRVRRTFHITPSHGTGAGKVGALRDRPVFVAVSAGGRYSGERARQPDFLTPYLTAILGTIGLHDLTFFSVQGTALGQEALMAARIKTDRALRAYFSTFFITDKVTHGQNRAEAG